MAGTENSRGEDEPDPRDDVKGGWQDFLFCIALHLTLPLLPLGLEHWFTGHIETKSVALTAALYAMAIGLSSRNLAFLGLGIVAGFICSAVFGFLSVQPELAHADTFAYAVILMVFVLHAIERFNRHVTDRVPFLEF